MMPLVFVLFAAFVFWAYRLDWEAWILLALSIGLVTGIKEIYTIMRRRHEKMEYEHIDTAPSRTWEEKQLKQLARKEHEAFQEAKLELVQSQKDTEDLYVLWVHQAKIPLSVLKLALEQEEPDIPLLKVQADRLEQAMNRILACTRLSSGQTDYVFHETSLDDVVRASIRKFRRTFILKKIKLEYAGTDARLITDAKWLEFVLDQLLDNALKYGRSRIVIELREDVLRIWDDGPSLPKSDLARLGQKNFTGRIGHESQASSGQGLYLAKQVCGSLDISLDFEGGEGFGVRLHLPLQNRKV
jgi:hypothetical protein